MPSPFGSGLIKRCAKALHCRAFALLDREIESERLPADQKIRPRENRWAFSSTPQSDQE